MKTDVFSDQYLAGVNDSLDFSDVDPAAIHLRQSDFARLLGVTRQRVCQMVSNQEIPTTTGGRINPSAAVAALLKADPETHRAKVLVAIRRQIDATNTRAAQADARAHAFAMEAQAATQRAREHQQTAAALLRRLLEVERALDLAEAGLIARVDSDEPLTPDAIGDIFSDTLTNAMRSSLADLLSAADPDLQRLAGEQPPATPTPSEVSK